MNPPEDEESMSPRSLSGENDMYRYIKQFGTANPRINLFFFLFIAAILYLISGLVKTQLIYSSEYHDKGERQSLRRVLHPGPRGDIYDRKGRLLVGNRPRFAAVVYFEELRHEIQSKYYEKVREKRANDESVNRNDLRNAARIEILQSYLDQINVLLGREEKVDAKNMERHFRQRLLLPLPLINDLTPSEYATIIEQIPVTSPIKIYTDSARFYPFRDTASHVLGYVGRNDNVPETDLPGDNLTTFSFKGKIGKNGLEKSLDDLLQGETGGAVWRVDPVGYRADDKPESEQVPTRGESITISLDAELQRVAENSLGDMTGAVVAMDVKSGEVLVMATKPNYDLNKLSPNIPQTVYDDIESRGAWLNRAIQGRYPPGSTFKIVTAIAAMRKNNLDPSKIYECGPYFTVGPRNFPEHGNQTYGQVDLPYALQVSSNVYFYQISLETGVEALAKEAKRFGFGSKTGIELPAENAGVVPTRKWKKDKLYTPWVSGDTANMAIGQGYLLGNPLQLATFTCSLARRETKTKPTMFHDPNRARKGVDHGGEPIGISDFQYNQILEGMERAAKPGGTAGRIGIAGVRIAAKTGSAQFHSDGQKLTIAWVIAFAPIENPQIAVAVMVEGTNPDDNYYGGTTAAPIARDVFDRYFHGSNWTASSR